jgi:hypothetical protein
MKCLNQLCNEDVPVGNYCPKHALSAGTIWRNVDEPATEYRDQVSREPNTVADRGDDGPSGGGRGDDGSQGGSY